MEKAVYPVFGGEELPLILGGIGKCGTGTAIRRENGVDGYLIIITESGTGEFSANILKAALGSGSIAFVPPGCPFSYRASDDGWSGIWITFGGSSAESVMNGFGFTETAVKHDIASGAVMALLARIAEAAEDPVSGAAASSALIYELLTTISEAVHAGGTDKRASENVIGPALRYIGKNYMRELTLERMAALCGVSLQHFCRVFKAAVGMRPMEYLARKRICAAKALLDDTDMKIYDIAAAVGYEVQNYFGITFKKYEGITPTEYRRARGIM